MTSLLWYFSVGAAIILVIRCSVIIKENSSRASVPLIPFVLGRKWTPAKALKVIVLPVAGYSLAVIAWPVLVYLKVKQLIEERDAPTQQEKGEFAVTRSDFLERLTIREVESREMVHDPLGAVPQVPFGHLNSVWKSFASIMKARDEIWSFVAISNANQSGAVMRSGYVLVRSGVPKVFLVMVKRHNLMSR